VTTHQLAFKVRWSEADPAGIVFYPRFFEWFDLATEALFEAVGLPWPVIFPQHRIVGVPIVESGARFVSPVRYGDEVTVRSTVTDIKTRTFRIEHEIAVGSTRCATGFEVRAWVSVPAHPGAPLRSKPIPEEIAMTLKGKQRP